MRQKIRILLLEDSSNDAEIIQRFLLKEKLPCVFRLATDEQSFVKALDEFAPLLVLSDNSMPGFSAIEALQLTRQRNRNIPFIIVTGTMSEEFAASIIKQGADDYILKDRMNRLPAAIVAALKQKRAEKEVMDYQYALENGYIVAITDARGSIQYINDNFCSVSGFSAEELVGTDLTIFNPQFHAMAGIEQLYAAIANGQVWKGEFCNKTKDGSLYWVDSTIVPFLDEKRKPYQYVIMCTNITERKKMEAALQQSNERFQYAVKASSDIIWELDFDTNEYRVHEEKEPEKMAGFNIIPGWQLGIDGEFVAAEDRGRIRASFHAAQADPQCKLWKEEYRIYSAEYNTLHITNHAIFVRTQTGHAIRAIGAITDITEKRKLELELQEQYRKEQLKIIATAVHTQEKERHAIGLELHDNVNQILLGTKLLLSVVLSQKGKNTALLGDCVNNLQHAIDENRKIAHVLVVPDFDTISLTDQLHSLTESMLTTSGIKTAIDTSGIDEALLDVQHKLAVYRIAQEQCSNIVKYSAAHNVYINLAVSGNLLKMLISDDGKGAEINKKTGGIGLHNIRGRLSTLNGTSSIHTSPGKGFILNVSIPLKE